VQRIIDRLNFCRIIVADLNTELLLDRHDQFDQIERVGIQILCKVRTGDNLALIDAQLLGGCLSLSMAHHYPDDTG